MVTANIALETQRLIDAADGATSLRSAYNAYMSALLKEPLWSPVYHGRARLPWRIAEQAKAIDSTWRVAFQSPGLYVFGGSDLVPLYWGMTEKGTLWKRLNGRYLGIKRDGCQKSQCQLAEDYRDLLLAKGIDGYPIDIREAYFKNYPSGPRLRHAVEFAKHGIEGIWLSLIPVSDSSKIRPLEAKIIAEGTAWNRANGCCDLLNSV